MAQFNVDSEVIAAKSAQAKSYVASITADVNGMTASLHDLQSSWNGLGLGQLPGRTGSLARNPAPGRRIHYPDQRGPLPRRCKLRRHRAGQRLDVRGLDVG